MNNFTGKYRAIVTAVNDPQSLGRVKARCPSISKEFVTAWATPCFPYVGDFYLPSVGEPVWLEFEQGDLSKPVWSGSWKPSGAAGDGSTRVITYAGTTITMKSGSITLSAGGATLRVENGKVFANGVDIEDLDKRLKRLGG